MKNVQIIDNADNCKYEIFGTTDVEFECIFPGGADVEFAEEFFDRVGEKRANEITEAMWKRRVEKKKCAGNTRDIILWVR